MNYEDDVIAIGSDGAESMKCMGKLLLKDYCIVHIICLAHTIHLVIDDVLYKKPKIKTNTSYIVSDTDNDENEENSDDNEDSDISGDESGEFQVLDIQESQNTLKIEFNPSCNNVITKVGNVFKIFKRSPVKNDDVLQAHDLKELGKELNVILFCGTRWNSLLVMITHFYDLRKPIEYAMVDMNLKFSFSPAKIDLIKDLIDALKPFNADVLKLCRQDITLVQAERILEILLDTLTSLDYEIANELYDRLVVHVSYRRNTEVIHLMEYFENSNIISWKNDSFGAKIDAKNICSTAITLIWIFILKKKSVHVILILLRIREI